MVPIITPFVIGVVATKGAITSETWNRIQFPVYLCDQCQTTLASQESSMNARSALQIVVVLAALFAGIVFGVAFDLNPVLLGVVVILGVILLIGMDKNRGPDPFNQLLRKMPLVGECLQAGMELQLSVGPPIPIRQSK